jgi:hypothetical protein
MSGEVTKNNIIILKDFHEHINVFTKSFGDYPLIGRWSIFYPKRHYNPYKSPLINNKCDFVLVFLCYGNLMVSKKTHLEM